MPAIQDAEESVSKAVAKALVRINSARAVELLIQTLQSGKKGRRWVAFALGELRDSRAAEPLVRALRDEDAGVRAQAARALATTAGKRAVESLGVALGDKERSVREAGIYSFAGIDDPLATDMLRAALSHDDLKTRTAATRAWKMRANPDGIAALLANLQTGNSDLSSAAAEALQAVLERSVAAAAIEDLRAVERLGNAVRIEAHEHAENGKQTRWPDRLPAPQATGLYRAPPSGGRDPCRRCARRLEFLYIQA